MNAATLQPGDTVLFACGDTWREQLVVNQSGAHGLAITYGSYGSGALPTLAGSNVLSTWTQNADGTWSSPCQKTPCNLYVDDTGANEPPLLHEKALATVETTPGSWYYDDTAYQIYVKLADQSTPSAHTIEASIRSFGVFSTNHSFIVIRNLNIRQTAQAGVYFYASKFPTGTADSFYNNDYNEFNVVEGCTIRNVGRGGRAWQGFNAPWDGGVYTRGYYKGSVPPPMLRGWVIANNVIGRIDDTPILDYDKGGIVASGTTGALITGNTVDTYNKMGINVRNDFGGETSYGPTVSGNKVGHNQEGIAIASTDNAIVTHNIVRNGDGYGIGIGMSSNALLTYNLIYNMAKSVKNICYNGIDVNAGSLNGRAYHNTISNVTSACMTLEGDNNTPSQGWIIEDNLFDGRTNSTAIANQRSTIYLAGDVTQFTFAYNLYADTVAHQTSEFQHPSGTYFGETAFETLTDDYTSLFVNDPEFVGTGNYHLATGSPAIGAGIPIAGLDPPSPNPNIGCY